VSPALVVQARRPRACRRRAGSRRPPGLLLLARPGAESGSGRCAAHVAMRNASITLLPV